MKKEEELKKGCGIKVFHSLDGYDNTEICGEHLGDGSIILCPDCNSELKGIQEERERINERIENQIKHHWEWLKKEKPEEVIKFILAIINKNEK